MYQLTGIGASAGAVVGPIYPIARAHIEIEDTEDGFRPASGFFQRVGDTQLSSRLSYTWFGRRGALLEQINPTLEGRGFWDHDAFWSGGGLEEGEVQLGLRFSFRNNVTLFGNVTRSKFVFSPDAYESLYVEQSDGSYAPFRPDQAMFRGLNQTMMGVFVSRWERVRGNVFYGRSETPIFDRRYGVAVAPARSHWVNARMSLYPTRALVMELSTSFSRLDRLSDGSEHSSAVIPRVRAQYQFSRALLVRAIVEYSSQVRAALTDPMTGLPLYSCSDADCSARAGSEGHDFGIEGLLSYEPSPGTASVHPDFCRGRG